MKSTHIELAHGNGGILSRQLIQEICVKHFGNSTLNLLMDSAVIDIRAGNIAFTTDSYVIRPVFFPGGNIGTLAVCGTVNDLSVMGAVPIALSCGFIIEEGFAISELDEIALSMRAVADAVNVRIVTGDTKVVEKGSADGIFINTSGIGTLAADVFSVTNQKIEPGDAVIVSGTLGDHAAAVMTARQDFPLKSSIKSDVAPLSALVRHVLASCRPGEVKIMRDPTRGGLATTLNEFTPGTGCSCVLNEKHLPVHEEVRAICEITGFDPLYLANEGKVVIIAASDSAGKIVQLLHEHDLGKNAAVIGYFEKDENEKVYLKTDVGGTRICDMLVSDMLPRIC
ncbi:MAG: hydrogenase expression/formation protein HypE [Spirochaetales bacterium]|nr:hydrogenase expression/formation protein HypE [Spirochaetales bacterium]